MTDSGVYSEETWNHIEKRKEVGDLLQSTHHNYPTCEDPQKRKEIAHAIYVAHKESTAPMPLDLARSNELRLHQEHGGIDEELIETYKNLTESRDNVEQLEKWKEIFNGLL